MIGGTVGCSEDLLPTYLSRWCTSWVMDGLSWSWKCSTLRQASRISDYLLSQGDDWRTSSGRGSEGGSHRSSFWVITDKGGKWMNRLSMIMTHTKRIRDRHCFNNNVPTIRLSFEEGAAREAQNTGSIPYLSYICTLSAHVRTYLSGEEILLALERCLLIDEDHERKRYKWPPTLKSLLFLYALHLQWRWGEWYVCRVRQQRRLTSTF